MLFQKNFYNYYGLCSCFCFVVFFISDLLLGRGFVGVWEGLVIGYFD